MDLDFVIPGIGGVSAQLQVHFVAAGVTADPRSLYSSRLSQYVWSMENSYVGLAFPGQPACCTVKEQEQFAYRGCLIGPTGL